MSPEKQRIAIAEACGWTSRIVASRLQGPLGKSDSQRSEQTGTKSRPLEEAKPHLQRDRRGHG